MVGTIINREFLTDYILFIICCGNAKIFEKVYLNLTITFKAMTSESVAII